MVVANKSARELAPEYDAVVVGSGYGGGVAASRLARMGYSVAVLEQGRLWRPGDFPTTAKSRRKVTRIAGLLPNVGDPTGLYRLTVGKGLTVFAATGVGGGSLINAGVTIRPNLNRLRNEGWPEAVVGDGLIEEGFRRGEFMLGTAPVPKPERFAKFAGMRKAADAADTSLHLSSMTIAHNPGLNAVGVMQEGCKNCGDCWSGCNAGAKNTVGITYIVDAFDHGAEIFCESRVDAIARTGDNWEISVQDLSGTKGFSKTTAGILVLGAGTLGTTELLLRAKQRGLPLSDMLGQKFSANGDDLVFAAKLKQPVHAIATGYPTQAPPGTAVVGPHSMARIDLGNEEEPICLHDGTMLAMMASIAPFKEVLKGSFGRAWRQIRGGIYGDEHSRTQIFYVVAHDDASGQLRLHKDQVIVDWPEYSDSSARVATENKVRAVIEGMGGEFHTNHFALKVFGGNRIIAHPMGGCAMAETSDQGVIAPDGRVFDPTKGKNGVHEGLYVCDGAAIPTSIGVSPLLTITALAERSMMLAADRLGRKLDVESSPERPDRDATM